MKVKSLAAIRGFAICLAALVLIAAFAPAEARGAEEKILMSFEKDEVSKWPTVSIKEDGPGRGSFLKGEFTPGSFSFCVFRKGEFREKNRQTAAKGNATHGEYALSRINRYARKKPGELADTYPLVQRARNGMAAKSIFNNITWPKECFEKDWSGYDLLRVDLWSKIGMAKVWLIIEDEKIEPPVLSIAENLPKGKWVTVELDLAKAVKERGLDLKKMVNIIILALTDGGNNILIDNIRLCKKGAKAKYKLLQDTRSMKLPDPPAGKAEFPKAGLQPDRSPVKLGKPVEIRAPFKTRAKFYPALVPTGFVSAFDNNHMLIGYMNGPRPQFHAIQTTDGGKTWTGLQGKDDTTFINFRNADHGSSCGEVFDTNGNAMFMSSIGCCGFSASPRSYIWMFTFKGKEGWEARIPKKGGNPQGYYVGSKLNLLDSDIRHCMHNGSTTRTDDGKIWHAWGHIGRWHHISVNVKYSIDHGKSWHTWEHGRSASIPGSRSENRPGPYNYKYPWITKFGGNGVAVFWENKRYNGCIKEGFMWSRFDGKKWTKPEQVPVPASAKPKTRLSRQPFGSAVNTGKDEIYMTGANFRGIMHWNGKSWKHEIPDAPSQGRLSLSGGTIVCVSGGEGRDFGRGGSFSATLKCWIKKPGADWQAPIDIGGGQFTIYNYKGFPGFVMPVNAPPNFVPVAWTENKGSVIKLVKVPTK